MVHNLTAGSCFSYVKKSNCPPLIGQTFSPRLRFDSAIYDITLYLFNLILSDSL